MTSEVSVLCSNVTQWAEKGEGAPDYQVFFLYLE